MKKLKGDLSDIADCKEPLPAIPLDLCLSGELEIEELKIREKIFRQLKERENFIVDGGKNKMILPLEATIFLTKSFNPLVSEDGNILVISEHKEISGSTEFEEIRLYLKDNDVKNDRGELIYKDDSSILDLIKANINSEVEQSTDRRSLKRFDAEDAIDKDILDNKSEGDDIFEKESSNKNIEEDIFGDIDKELSSGKSNSDTDIFGDIDKELSSGKSNSDTDIFGDIDKEISKSQKPKKEEKGDIFGDIDKEISKNQKPKKEEKGDIFGDIDKEISKSENPKKEESSKKKKIYT